MRFGWRGALGILVSVACLYLAFRNVQWSAALDQARHANYWLLLLSAAAATGMFPLRARRWRTILDPVAPRLPFGPLWRSVAVGMMVNNVVPLRAGELARAFALTRERPDVTFSTALASLVVDRVFDAIVVLLLLALSMVAAGFPAGLEVSVPVTSTCCHSTVAHLAEGFAVVPIVALIVLYALVFFPERLIRLFELLARRVSPLIERRGAEMLRRFAEGLSVLKTPKHFAAVFWWTLLHWLLQPVAFWLALAAFDIHVPWSATLFLQGIIVILVALPSAPGFFGLFELGAQFALGLYLVSATEATTWALVFHVASFIPITVIGAYYATRLGMSVSHLPSETEAA